VVIGKRNHTALNIASYLYKLRVISIVNKKIWRFHCDVFNKF